MGWLRQRHFSLFYHSNNNENSEGIPRKMWLSNHVVWWPKFGRNLKYSTGTFSIFVIFLHILISPFPYLGEHTEQQSMLRLSAYRPSAHATECLATKCLGTQCPGRPSAQWYLSASPCQIVKGFKDNP